MKLRELKTGKVMPCTKRTWDSIVARNKDHLFEVLEHDAEVTPIATKRTVTEVEVPPQPTIQELPEHKEIKAINKRKKKREGEKAE